MRDIVRNICERYLEKVPYHDMISCKRTGIQNRAGHRGVIMETMYYIVETIDGDYAQLKRTDAPSDDLKLVARALLPADIREGSQLKYEMFQYELIG